MSYSSEKKCLISTHHGFVIQVNNTQDYEEEEFISVIMEQPETKLFLSRVVVLSHLLDSNSRNLLDTKNYYQHYYDIFIWAFRKLFKKRSGESVFNFNRLIFKADTVKLTDRRNNDEVRIRTIIEIQLNILK